MAPGAAGRRYTRKWWRRRGNRWHLPLQVTFCVILANMTLAVVSPESPREKTVLRICNVAETVGGRVWSGVQLHPWYEPSSVEDQTHFYGGAVQSVHEVAGRTLRRSRPMQPICAGPSGSDRRRSGAERTPLCSGPRPPKTWPWLFSRDKSLGSRNEGQGGVHPGCGHATSRPRASRVAP